MQGDISFTGILKSLNSITEFSSNEPLSERALHCIKMLSAADVNIILPIICNQQPLVKPTYFIYKQTLQDDRFEYITTFDDPKSNTPPINFDVSDDSLILNILSFEDIIKLLNSNLTHIFLTVVYFCNSKDCGHQSVLFLNVVQQEIYLIEPNGRPTFYDSVFKHNVGIKLENMLRTFFEEFNVANGYQFRYIHTNEWNPTEICLNKQYESIIGSGFCVALSLILCHVIVSFQYHPTKIYKMLKDLSNGEMLIIINDYSSAIFNILNQADAYKNNRMSLFDAYEKTKIVYPIESYNKFVKLTDKIDKIDSTIKRNSQYYDFILAYIKIQKSYPEIVSIKQLGKLVKKIKLADSNVKSIFQIQEYLGCL
jgi:hypothetical protein